MFTLTFSKTVLRTSDMYQILACWESEVGILLLKTKESKSQINNNLAIISVCGP